MYTPKRASAAGMACSASSMGSNTSSASGRPITEQGSAKTFALRTPNDSVLGTYHEDDAGAGRRRGMWCAVLIRATCHCGAVRITVLSKPEYLNDCDCSRCQRFGALWALYESSTVVVIGHPEDTSAYVGGKRATRRCAARRAGASLTGCRSGLTAPR